MSSSWTERNEITKIGRTAIGVTRTSSSINAASSATDYLASKTNTGYTFVRDSYVKHVLDPVVGNGVRAMMKFLVSSSFYPHFDSGISQGLDHHGGAYILDPMSVDRDRGQIPPRMWNIDTGNLDEALNADKIGYYCILSHSWKGCEIDYAFVSKVKQKIEKKMKYEDMCQNEFTVEDRKIAEFEVKKYKYLDGVNEKNDVQRIKAQCDENIRLQRLVIDALAPKHYDMRDILHKRAKVKDAEWAHSTAKKNVQLQKREHLAKQMAYNTLHWRIKEMGVNVESESIQDVEDDEERLAEALLDEAKTECEGLSKALCDAVDKLFPLLQQRLSAHKIERSIAETKRILDTGIFPEAKGSRYLWNDTCCINKAIVGEHIESIALMGEWYTNAEFCVVHLDTNPSSSEWVTIWDHLQKDSLHELLPNFKAFEEVSQRPKPYWATRAWTLQELALSKMIFFVNNAWTPLSRPVENLGPYYYHCSHLEQCVHSKDVSTNDIAVRVLDDIMELRKAMDEDEKIKFFNVNDKFERYHRLIGILNFLGVDFPRNMDEVIANAHIHHTIKYAAEKTARTCADNMTDAPRIKRLFRSFGYGPNPSNKEVELLIKLLLRSLVEIRDDVLRDRNYIQSFSDVPAEECCRGAGKTSLTAFEILSLASRRNVTVAIDQAYSLMGMLGVKIAAFHAEGLTKALSRLLDEVVTTSRDVSVFHWSGRGLGSPIIGRSLYPVNFDAFKLPEKASNERVDQLVAHELHNQRDGLLKDSENLSILLRKMLELIKNPTQINQPIDEFRLVLDKLSSTDIKNIRPWLHILRKTVTYFRDPEKYDMKSVDTKETNAKAKEIKGNDGDNGKKPSRFGIKGHSLPSSISFGMHGRSKASDSQAKRPDEKETPEIDITALNLGKFEKKDTKSPTEVSASPKPPTNRSTSGQKIKTMFKEKYDSTLGTITSTFDTSKTRATLNEWVETLGPIPPCDLTCDLDGPATTKWDQNSQERGKEDDRPEESMNDGMISPNPIIVNTSGIQGVFDIQRVVVRIHNGDDLRKEMKKSKSANHKIGGECTISTGLASVTVAFCCEKNVLQKQLDVCDVIEKTILEKEIGTSTTPSSQGESAESAELEKESPPDAATPPSADANTRQEEKDAYMKVKTPEQTRVRRMLDFVQESDLNLIAGEWVLARFSGVGDAKWFLCRLELGSTHDYYGWRIATDDFDFSAHAVPEKGLVGWWETFMNDKKKELCRIVGLAIHSRKLSSFETKGQDQKFEQAATEEKEDLTWAMIRKRGLENSKVAGAWLLRNITDMYAEQLNQTLDQTVLAPVPKHLRIAIMNLHQDKHWLPAMFIPSVRVHMF